MPHKFIHFRKVNPSRVHLLEFATQAASSVSKGATVLDAGAGQSPYKPLFKDVIYESADFCQVGQKTYGEMTYVCDLTDIPVPDNKYDLVLLTQVLEHVPEPRLVLQEIHRVLRPGGSLWLSAPLFYEEHDIPYDYYRYTQFGLRYLLESTGFTIEKITWLEGYYGTLSHQMHQAYRTLPVNPLDYGGGLTGFVGTLAAILIKPLSAGLSIFYGILDMQHKYTTKGMCKNYTAVAVKKA